MVALNASPALALNAIELTDQRVTNKEGLQLIYEVRWTPLPRLDSETAWFRSSSIVSPNFHDATAAERI